MRRTSTRIAASGASLLLLAGVLTGCSIVEAVDADTARTARGPVTIWYSNNEQEVAWGEQVVSSWNAAHPEEPVKGQQIPTGKSSEAVIQASIIAGTEPCLIYNTSPASVPSFQAIGGLVDLDQFPGGREYVEDRSGELAEQYRSPDGDYYQLPWKSNPVMIFYNKAVFAAAGLDPDNPKLSSYADFLAAGQQIVSSGAARYAIYPSAATDFFQSWFDFYPAYIAQSGGQQLVEDGRATFDDPAGKQVFDFWRQIYAGGLAGQEVYTGDAFADGTAAMATVGPWAINAYDKVDWGVVPVPTADGTPSEYTFSDAKNVAMYASCENRATAFDFLKYSTSQEQDGQFLSLTGQMPTRTDILGTYADYFAANPAYRTFAELAQGVVEVPNIPNSVQIWQAFRDAWAKNVIFGSGNVDTALQTTATTVDDLVVKK